ncbi:phosphate signaling complex protein PhoU [Clostridium frigidicarnis]|uniref:Phosphate-specific transport system accessory protein PhoU n=1 Tax=Clostridium frigidicarnis TaxID=84698 RepID=A0A1I0VP02_9CLOT|nr:phosphate signaling complex protein PhoU [Clostridium frigidicarnis]SFA78051.1 phosphate uptake regulator, PhoU [Clostridium frigidicarnis]
MARISFDNELKDLHNDLLRMSSIVEKQIYLSIESLKKQDDKLASEIIKNDDLVDDLQREIEGKCIKLIAKEQPVATDLRNIFTTTKIVTDLERMADHAVDIAKIVIRLKDEKYIKELIDIPQMSNLLQKMIKNSIDSYITGNVNLAYKTCKMDDEIDEIYRNVFTELLELMVKDSAIIHQATQFLFVCKFLERMADHATNICEWTIYLVTGDTVDLND